MTPEVDGPRRAGHDLFVCHSFEDAERAAALCARLEGAGVRCWIAPRDPVAGIPYGRQIVEAIESCPIVLLVFSQHANSSRAVLNELEISSNRSKTIVPVRIDDVAPSPDLEFYIRSIHWFDAVTKPFDIAALELTKFVQSMLVSDSSLRGGSAAAQDDSIATTRHNLPLEVTSFVGRSREISEITAFLEKSRLVTIVGTGGLGKTRTALRLGAGAFLADGSSGVWFIELAPLTDGALIAGAIAHAVGVALPADGDPNAELASAFRTRRLLLILDNCEHLVDSVAKLVSLLLRECPLVSVLATSRQALGIAGETVYRLSALDDAEAVALFVARAQATNVRFNMSDADAHIITKICRQLDGIALAIELAAARMNVLTPGQLHDRLAERFRVLSGSNRDLLPRQKTLLATIDWSHDLLDEREKLIFRRIGTFVDGFTLDAAGAVCADDSLDSLDVFDVLASLVDKSLVVAEFSVDALRYRMLESMRAYARQKLEAADEVERCAKLHFDYFCALFAETDAQYEATMAAALLDRLAVELEDVRGALDWAVRAGTPAEAAELFVHVRLWDSLGLHYEAIERAQRYVQLLGRDGVLMARLWERIAFLAGRKGNLALASESAERAVECARAAADPSTLADCLVRFASAVANARRFDDALTALDEAERIADPPPRRRLQMLEARGRICIIRGDLATAARCLDQTMDLCRSIDNAFVEVSSALNLGEIAHELGDTRRAIDVATRALARAEQLPDRGVQAAHLLRNLAGYYAFVDDLDRSRDAATRAVESDASREPGGTHVAIALEHLALVVALCGETREAALLEGYSSAVFARFGFEREHTERTTHERLLAALKADSKDGDLSDLLDRGAAFTAEAAIARATSAADRHQGQR